MNFATADLCDEFESDIQVAEPIFRNFGKHRSFFGKIATVRVFEDNSLVRGTLEKPGLNRVLVVNGGASLRVALVGDQLARLAYENNWSGIVVNGCIRDSEEINRIAIGLKALNTIPRKSIKKGNGELEVEVSFAGVTFTPGEYLYADEDGIILSKNNLLK